MKSTAHFRGNKFEFASSHQYADGHGGHRVTCVEYGTKAASELNLDHDGDFTPEETEIAIAYCAMIEKVFERKFEARMPTPQERHALLQSAEHARLEKAKTEAEHARIREDFKAEAAARQEELARLNAEIAAKAEAAAKAEEPKVEEPAAAATSGDEVKS